MADSADLLKQVNNAVLDLQASTYQSFQHPLQVLAALLADSALRELNEQLTLDLDLDGFLEASMRTQGGTIGSAQLLWPSEPIPRLGLKWLLIQRLATKPQELIHFAHTFYYTGAKISSDLQNFTRQLIIPFTRDYKDYVVSQSRPMQRPALPHSRRVFIVHGHDGEARETVARFLERLDFDPLILHEQANMGQTIMEKVEANADVGFAVVLLTPDDVGCRRGAVPGPRARQNVMLELGYFMGLLGRQRVCALKRGDLEIPSDFSGVVYTAMDDAGGWRLALARELLAAGYEVDVKKIV